MTRVTRSFHLDHLHLPLSFPIPPSPCHGGRRRAAAVLVVISAVTSLDSYLKDLYSSPFLCRLLTREFGPWSTSLRLDRNELLAWAPNRKIFSCFHAFFKKNKQVFSVAFGSLKTQIGFSFFKKGLFLSPYQRQFYNLCYFHGLHFGATSAWTASPDIW